MRTARFTYSRKKTISGEPRNWTEAEQQNVIFWYARLSLTELRRRQSLCRQQQELNYKTREQNPEFALQAADNLAVIDRLIVAAIDRKVFGSN